MHDFESLVNRLGKNAAHLLKWARRNGLEAWRLYDRDIPQFPFAIDVYGEHLHVQEYDTGRKEHPAERARYLEGVIEAAAFVTGFDKGNIHLKQRRRQRGKSQYEATGIDGGDFTVHEYGLDFWVNLDKYLDTGLFLDHRETRKMVRAAAQGRRVLNLFAYTGSFSVYAAAGGAASVETVDMSNTYLNWAQRNFALNGLNDGDYRFVRADVIRYLKETAQAQREFDLIVMDPPSFSNSKKMTGTLDISRDHTELVQAAMKLCAPDGVLYFSNNRKGFVPDPAWLDAFCCEEITRRTVPEDFRRRHSHRCWRIKH